MYKSIKYRVPEKITQAVAEFLSSHNIANRGEFDGSYQNQFDGKVGECVVYSRLFKKMLNLNGGDGFDGGVDIRYKGFTIDVKTMGRKTYTRDSSANNFTDLQKKYPTDILVFCSFNKKENILEICGWIFKCELEEKGLFRSKGSSVMRGDGLSFICDTDMWEVSNDKLYPFSYLESYESDTLKKVQCDRINKR